MPNPDLVAQRLRAAREARGWSLKQAAEHTGINAMTLGAWERGDRQPGLSTLRRWVTVFGLDLQLVEAEPTYYPTTYADTDSDPNDA